MDLRVPDLEPSSAASSPLAPLDTPSSFEQGFAAVHDGLSETDTDSREAGSTTPGTKVRGASHQADAASATSAQHGARRGSAASQDMASLIAAHSSRNRRGSDELREDTGGFARRTSLAPRPSITPLHVDYILNGNRRQSAGLSEEGYPGHPAPIHLQPPSGNVIAPTFRFGSLNLNDDKSFAFGQNSHAPYIGTPAAELGPFEYPSADGTTGSGRNSPARPGINPLADSHTAAKQGSFGAGEADAAGLRSVTTGHIPVLPATRRPSVIHSATVATLPQAEHAGEDAESRGSVLSPKLVDLTRRRPSVLLSRLLPPPAAPVPPSLLGARRGSLPAASLFPKGGPASRIGPDQDGSPLSRPSLAQGWTPTPSSAAVPGQAISAAYLYNRRSSLAAPALLASSSIASPIRPIGSLPTSIVGDASPAPSSRNSFSSHSTVTGQESPATTPLGFGTRRQSLPVVDAPPSPTALEAYRRSKVAANSADDGSISPNDARPLSLSNLSAHASAKDNLGTSALSTASGSSSGHDAEDAELSQVARVAAAIRERRRSSRNSLLSRGSLASIPADEAVLQFPSSRSQRGSTDSHGPRSQASISSDDSGQGALTLSPNADTAPGFAAFSFPAKSPIKRTPPTRPGLETIPSDDKDSSVTDQVAPEEH